MPSRSRYAHPPTEDAELTRGDAIVINLTRQALAHAIEELAPDGSNKVALAATAVCGLFADLICGMSTAPGIAEVINRQIRGCGFELVPTRRH